MTIVTHALVGREEELASLAAALDAPPAVAVVHGEAGIGCRRAGLGSPRIVPALE